MCVIFNCDYFALVSKTKQVLQNILKKVNKMKKSIFFILGLISIPNQNHYLGSLGGKKKKTLKTFVMTE